MRRFFSDEAGNIALLLAFVLPAIMMGTVAAVDYSNGVQYKGMLQDAVDAAALASVREMRHLDYLKGVDVDAEVTRIAGSVVNVQLANSNLPAETEATVLDEDSVRVRAWREMKPLLGDFYGARALPVEAYATAQLYGAEDLCMLLTTDEPTPNVLNMNDNGSIDAEGCLLHVNSSAPNAIDMETSTSIHAKTVCSGGGIAQAGSAEIDARAMSDCTTLDNPLAHRLVSTGPIGALVDSMPCLTSAETIIDNGSPATLPPGRYCNNVTIRDNVTLTLDPGEYLFTVLNRDYAATTVPVPGGFRGENDSLRLVK